MYRPYLAFEPGEDVGVGVNAFAAGLGSESSAPECCLLLREQLRVCRLEFCAFPSLASLLR